MADFVRTFLNHHVGAGVGFVESQSVGEPRDQNDTYSRTLLAQACDELHAVHLRHLVIGDYDIEPLFAAQFESVLRSAAGHDLVTQLLKDAAARRESKAVVVEQKNASAEAGGRR